jgi:hypothetical protein
VAVLLACAAALLATAATTPARATSTEPATARLPYVALGDSYSAGYGLQPTTDQPVPGCDQSAEDYPHQLAAALDLALTDVTCSGAVTANLTTTAQNTDQGTAPPQDNALNSSIRIVTLTIGGNDQGFAKILTYCAAASANGPLILHPLQPDCRSHFTAPGADNLHDNLAATVSPHITAALAAIHTKAPHAKIFVLGYPALAPDAANTPANGCFRPAVGNPLPTDGYPFTNTDVPFLLQTEQSLDDAIQSDTLAAGDAYISTLQASLAHSPCAASTQPPGTPWINGLSLASIFPPSIEPGAMHPNTAGVTYLTAQVTATIKNAFPPTATRTDKPAAHRTLSPAQSLALAATAGIGVILLLRRRTRTRAAKR